MVDVGQDVFVPLQYWKTFEACGRNPKKYHEHVEAECSKGKTIEEAHATFPETFLSASSLTAYASAVHIEEACSVLVGLLTQKDWSFLPAELFNITAPPHRFRQSKRDFLWHDDNLHDDRSLKDYSLHMGILFRDYRELALCTKEKGPDLYLALVIDRSVDCCSESAGDPVADVLRGKFPSVAITGSRGWRYSLVEQRPLAEVIDGYITTKAQIDAMYALLKEWSLKLLEDSTVQELIRKEKI
jgi:hypothetical protein